MTEKGQIRILIADDHKVVREGLATMVENRNDMSVVGQASNGQEACELFRQHCPDVTLMDMSMPGKSGLQAIETIREEFPQARILILTVFEGDESIFQGLRAGALGYLFKGTPHQELVEAIRAVHAGQKYLPSAMAAKSSDRLSSQELTRSELEVLRLMATGHSNLQIANTLALDSATVTCHVNAILYKLHASDRTHAVTTAIRRGLVPRLSA